MRRRRSTRWMYLVVPLLIILTIYTAQQKRDNPNRETVFCRAVGHGSSAAAAIRSYLHQCGPNYTIARQPLVTTSDGSYTAIRQYVLSVNNNAAGTIALVSVGEPTPGAPWRTFGTPTRG